MEYIKGIPEFKPFLEDSDHIDVKVVEGRVTLREFIASMLSYRPWWLVLLFRIRTIVARILRLDEPDIPEDLPVLRPDDVPMTPGGEAVLFILRAAEDDQFWIAETPEDRHLRAYIAIVVEHLEDDLRRFHIVTIVKYKHWTGPVYFNLIRPFHHIVVYVMARAGVRKG